jgi:hypothetical protein
VSGSLLDQVVAATEARDAAPGADETPAPGGEAPPPRKRPWRNAADLLAGRDARVSGRIEVERRGAREVDRGDVR